MPVCLKCWGSDIFTKTFQHLETIVGQQATEAQLVNYAKQSQHGSKNTISEVALLLG